jgi:hypothetical protein
MAPAQPFAERKASPNRESAEEEDDEEQDEGRKGVSAQRQLAGSRSGKW